MEKKVYCKPDMLAIVIEWKEEDIICSSADTDIPFETPDTDVPFELNVTGNNM